MRKFGIVAVCMLVALALPGLAQAMGKGIPAQAMLLAIDRQAGVDGSLTNGDREAAKARALMEEPGPSTQNPLHLKITAGSNSALSGQLQDALRAMLSQIYIEVEPVEDSRSDYMTMLYLTDSRDDESSLTFHNNVHGHLAPICSVNLQLASTKTGQRPLNPVSPALGQAADALLTVPPGAEADRQTNAAKAP